METVQLNEKINYSVPISENFKENGNFVVRGIAINATTTRNGVKYEAFELEAAAPTLRNKPVLKDHEAIVDNIVGRTTDNIIFNREGNYLPFEAIIKDKVMAEKIQSGLVTNVSIGALVSDIDYEEQEDGSEVMIARGIEFVELSLVAVPGDPGAGFTHALSEKLNEKKEEVKMDDVKIKTPKVEEAKELAEIRAEVTALKEDARKELVEKYNTVCEAASIEAKSTDGLTNEALRFLLGSIEEVLEASKIVEEAEEETEEAEEEAEEANDEEVADEADEEATDEANDEEAADDEEADEEALGEEAMKGKTHTEEEASEDLKGLVFSEGSLSGYSLSYDEETVKEKKLYRMVR